MRRLLLISFTIVILVLCQDRDCTNTSQDNNCSGLQGASAFDFTLARQYRILGLSEGASMRDVKRAYRKFALKYHPDKTKNNVELQKKFIEIQKAYEAISEAGGGSGGSSASSADVWADVPFAKGFIRSVMDRAAKRPTKPPTPSSQPKASTEWWKGSYQFSMMEEIICEILILTFLFSLFYVTTSIFHWQRLKMLLKLSCGVCCIVIIAPLVIMYSMLRYNPIGMDEELLYQYYVSITEYLGGLLGEFFDYVPSQSGVMEIRLRLWDWGV